MRSFIVIYAFASMRFTYSNELPHKLSLETSPHIKQNTNMIQGTVFAVSPCKLSVSATPCQKVWDLVSANMLAHIPECLVGYDADDEIEEEFISPEVCAALLSGWGK